MSEGLLCCAFSRPLQAPRCSFRTSLSSSFLFFPSTSQHEGGRDSLAGWPFSGPLSLVQPECASAQRPGHTGTSSLGQAELTLQTSGQGGRCPSSSAPPAPSPPHPRGFVLSHPRLVGPGHQLAIHLTTSASSFPEPQSFPFSCLSALWVCVPCPMAATPGSALSALVASAGST